MFLFQILFLGIYTENECKIVFIVYTLFITKRAICQLLVINVYKFADILWSECLWISELKKNCFKLIDYHNGAIFTIVVVNLPQWWKPQLHHFNGAIFILSTFRTSILSLTIFHLNCCPALPQNNLTRFLTFIF